MPKIPQPRRGSGPGEDRNRTYGSARQPAGHRKQPNWGRRFTIFTVALVVISVAAMYFYFVA